MSLVSLLATTTLITLANLTPMIQAADQAKARIPVDYDHFFYIMQLNRKDLDLKNLMDGTGYVTSMDTDAVIGDGGGSGTSGFGAESVVNLTRGKRIGTLSISDSLAVLRDRVMLELARRKQLEESKLIDENRSILDNVGKRSDNTQFVYRDYRIPRKRKLIYKIDDGSDKDRQQQLERLLIQ